MSNQLQEKKDNQSNSALVETQEIDSSILLELGSIGAGHAATSLSDVLQQPITIEVPCIHNMEPHLIPNFFNKHEMPTAAVYLRLSENYGCDILLMFELTEAKKIATMMTCAPSVDELDPEMEKSAIHELSNILIGSFLSAISDFVGISLMPTTPESKVDTFDAVLDSFLISQSMKSEYAMVFETKFKRQNEDAKCNLIIFPSQELKEILTEKSKHLLS